MEDKILDNGTSMLGEARMLAERLHQELLAMPLDSLDDTDTFEQVNDLINELRGYERGTMVVIDYENCYGELIIRGIWNKDQVR